MKKYITIDGDSSDWYEKAVFTLKSESASNIPDNLFLYAEQIVENYLKKNSVRSNQVTTNKRSQTKYIDYFFYVALFMCTISLIVLIWRMLL